MIKQDKYFGLSPRIARWKLDTSFENWLSNKSDNSEFWKLIYFGYYYIFDHKYYVKGYKMAKYSISHHESGKSISDFDSIVRDMIYCLHRYGFSFQDYCIYDFANNKSVSYRQSFVADKLRYHYCDILNSKEVFMIMTDKYQCYSNYKQFYKREVVGCFSINDNESYIKFVSQHSQFIYKPLEEHSGHGIEIFNVSEIDIQIFFNTKLNQGPFVLEELIEQGHEVAIMHPQSVNSCRVLTFTNGNEVTIVGATWRVGSGEAIKDNAGSGGIYAFINPNTGVVETDAINYLGKHFDTHPDTGIRFKGFQMPLWEDAVEMVNQMATLIKGSTLIAWDIAYSRNGWVMVEANENGDWCIIQSNKLIGYKDRLFNLMDSYLS